MGKGVDFMMVTRATNRNCEASEAQQLISVVKQLCKVTVPSLAPSRRLRPWPEEDSGVWGHQRSMVGTLTGCVQAACPWQVARPL